MTASNLISVNTKLVLQTLVGQIGEEVRRRVAATEGADALAEGAVPSFGADPGVSLQIALRGYHARATEVEMFEPARQEVPGLADRLAELTVAGAEPREAALAHARSVAEAEPLGRPAPGDGAFAWSAPGPGGHVRHYVALGAIGEVIGESDEPHADLKRPWTFGFCVCCCEDAPRPVAP